MWPLSTSCLFIKMKLKNIIAVVFILDGPFCFYLFMVFIFRFPALVPKHELKPPREQSALVNSQQKTAKRSKGLIHSNALKFSLRRFEC